MTIAWPIVPKGLSPLIAARAPLLRWGFAQQAGSLNSYIITWHGLFQISYRFAACRLPPAACRLPPDSSVSAEQDKMIWCCLPALEN